MLRAALLPLALTAALCACTPERPHPRHLVLIVVDTLRKDRLGSYGYERPTTPALDALAARGQVYERHVAPASHTVPSTLTLMLSQEPAEHGLVHRKLGQFERRRPQFGEEFVFLAEVLHEAGFATGGYVSNPFLKRENGFAQGFEAFLQTDERGPQLTSSALDWLSARAREERRIFLYVHYMEPHWPYMAPTNVRSRFEAAPYDMLPKPSPRPRALSEQQLEELEKAYDAEVAAADVEIGRVAKRLDEVGLAEETLLVVTSDHGEEFMEHGGLYHGTHVYGELVVAPLVVVAPGRVEPGSRVAHLSRHLDLAPTLLDWLGVARPRSFRGETLLAPAPIAFAENGPWRAVYGRTHKLVVNRETGEQQVYAIDDEHDREPLDADAPELADAHEAYEARRTARRRGEASDWSPEELERLRALGYVDGEAE